MTPLFELVPAVLRFRLSDGALLFLGENSSARVTDRQQNMAEFRLETVDRSAVVVTRTSGSLLDCEDAVTLSDHASVRIDVHPVATVNSFTGLPYGGHSCGIKVYAGAAAQLETVVTVLRAGPSAHLNRRAADRIPLYDFDAAQLDALNRWSREQARGARQLADFKKRYTVGQAVAFCRLPAVGAAIVSGRFPPHR